MPSISSFIKKRSKQSKSGYPSEDKENATPTLKRKHSGSSRYSLPSTQAAESRDGLEQNFNTFSEAVEDTNRRHTVKKYVFGTGVAGAAVGFIVAGPVGLVVGGGLASAAGARAGAQVFRRKGKHREALPSASDAEHPAKMSLRRARLMERWARLQLLDLDDREHLESLVGHHGTKHRCLVDKGRVLDYVISEFAPLAEVCVNGTDDRDRAEAASHLRPLVRLLNAPGVAEVVEQTNSLWASEWHGTSSPTPHSQSRADTVLPTLVVLPEAARAIASPKAKTCMPLPNSSKTLQPSLLVQRIALWSADFLVKHARADVSLSSSLSYSLTVDQRSDLEPPSSHASGSQYHSVPSVLGMPSTGNVDGDRFLSVDSVLANELPDGCVVPPLGAEEDSDCDHSDSDEIQSVVTAISKVSKSESKASALSKVSQSESKASAPGELQLSGLARGESATDDHSYDEPDATELQVRGPLYLSDGVKVSSAPALTSLCSLDLLRCASGEELPWHASASPDSAVAQLRALGEKRFLFVVHFRLTPLQWVVVFALPSKLPDSPGSKLFWDFIENFSDEERSARFKVIPRVPEGPFLARAAVPQKPAILGKKLDCRFFHNPGDHFEVAVDVFSSYAVQYACSQVLMAARKITIDVGFLIEGKETAELPEVLLGIFRARRIDVGRARSSSQTCL